MSLLVMYISLAICATTLAWGYLESGWSIAAWVIGAIALLWLVALLYRRYWAAGIGLLLAVFAAGCGIWLDLSIGWMTAGVLGALVNWDLANFLSRLQPSESEDDHERRLLERSRMTRLAIVTLAGLILASAAMWLQLRFRFEWALFLALTGAWGIAQLISWLRKGPE